MKRRWFLGIAISAGIGKTAGCLRSGGDTYATLQELYLLSIRDDPVTIELRIEQDDTDEVVHQNSYDVGAGLDGTEVDCVWPDEPLNVMVRPADADEWNVFTTADKEGCLSVASETGERGTSFVSSHGECPIRSANCHTTVGE